MIYDTNAFVVPFVDLKVQYQTIKTDIDKAIQDVLSNAIFIGAKPVKDFEEQFANFIGVKQCISCGNGTDSIEILLEAMDIGRGDEVIVPAISWISTSEAVSNVGAKPVFVDIEQDFYCINSNLIEEKITARTKAIIPVHLYGQVADMPKIMQIAKRYNLKVLEDCAQAHYAKIGGQTVGTFGDCASFSFYPSKNLGAYGDGGAMISNNLEIAEKARRITNHGQLSKHDHQIEGRNSRLDTLQAAILLAKLPYLETWTQKRITNSLVYEKLLINKEILKPKTRPDSQHVFHLYVIKTNKRQDLQEILTKNGIQTAIHYPIALPFLPCYAYQKAQKTDYPVAAQFQDEILSLPMYAELSEEQIRYIAQVINRDY